MDLHSRGVANTGNPCLYGTGCYFAHSARYSHHYAHKVSLAATGSGSGSGSGVPWQRGQPCLHQLLVVQVICGKSKVSTLQLQKVMTWACYTTIRVTFTYTTIIIIKSHQNRAAMDPIKSQ